LNESEFANLLAQGVSMTIQQATALALKS
jgi:hypothetical protein